MLLLKLAEPLQIDQRCDANAPYTHALIHHSEDYPATEQCRMGVHLGWIDATNRFQAGVCNGADWGFIRSGYVIAGADYDALEKVRTDKEGAGPAYFRAQYQWLIDNGHLAGSIVDEQPTAPADE